MPSAAGNTGNKAVCSVWSTYFRPTGRNAVQFCSSLRCYPGFFRNVATYIRNHNASHIINSNFWNDTHPKRGNRIIVQTGGTCSRYRRNRTHGQDNTTRNLPRENSTQSPDQQITRLRTSSYPGSSVTIVIDGLDNRVSNSKWAEICLFAQVPKPPPNIL